MENIIFCAVFFDVVLLILDGTKLWKLFQKVNSLSLGHEDTEGLNYFEITSYLNAMLQGRHF